ncbi:MAG: TonB-dependent receptor [Pseudomonadota bacterium]
MRLLQITFISLILLSFVGVICAEELETISITDTAIVDETRPEPPITATSDTATAMKQVPGGNVHGNGQISGQTYYRGVFGPRMNVLIDGRNIESGGPNWMDPPLHYAPNTLVESIEVQRGIDSISNGSTIGTTVDVKLKSSNFTDSEEFSTEADLAVSGHSVDTGYNAGAIIGVSNDTHRFHITGSRDDGNSYRTGDSRISGTEYERDSVGAGYGFQFNDSHEISFDARYVGSKDTGTPALPLDLDFFHSQFYNSRYAGEVNNFLVEIDIYHTEIDHRMNNFELRDPPDFNIGPNPPPFQDEDRRVVNVDSKDTGAKLALTHDLYAGEITFGVNASSSEHGSVVTDPDFDAFRVVNFNDAEADYYGAFTEWNGTVNNIDVEIGIRYQRVETDADDVSITPVILVPAVRLADAFNASDRSQTDNNIDWVIKGIIPVSDELNFVAGYARKTRSPSYIERYGWIPLNVNAGLGDGNNYVGDVDLDPEWSNQFELGLQWADNRAFINPSVYYQRINNYIQGVPTDDPDVVFVSSLNGDPTPLQFANVDAEIYGIDTDWGYQLNDQWGLSGQASYIRGKRKDISDNLYNIAPPTASLAITRFFGNGSATIEGVAVARQTKISDTITDDPLNPNNSNSETAGYGLINVFGEYNPVSLPNTAFQVGVENLLDREYTDHLNGFNRANGNGFTIGERLPGPGINAFVTFEVAFQ